MCDVHRQNLTCQTREGELRDFNPHFIGTAKDVDGFHSLSDNDTRGHGDKIVIQRLRDEWERARYSQIALNDPQFIVLCGFITVPINLSTR